MPFFLAQKLISVSCFVFLYHFNFDWKLKSDANCTKMNLFKKAFSTQPSKETKAEFGTDFHNKQKQYFEIDRVLAKLLADIRKYAQLWNDLLSMKTQIYGYLLYFYNIQSKKRDVIDNIFKYHQKPLDDSIRDLCENYEYYMICEIEKIRQCFPNTRREIDSLTHKKKLWEQRKSAFQNAKKLKRPNYAYLTQFDDEVRRLKYDYESTRRKLIRELDSKLNARGAMLDGVVAKVE